jgi:cell wall-associated NlpC family hydrolase
MTLGHGSAQAAGNCHAYGATSAAANRAIAAACAEVNKGTPYSWAGGHHAKPGPSTGAIYDEGGEYFDDRNKVGLDCSGLVRWAWYEATDSDFGAGSTWAMPSELTSHGFSRVGSQPTQPGDVVVYNGHTVIYLGNGLVVQAEGDRAGLNVRSLSGRSDVTGVFRYTGHGGTPPPVTPPPTNHGGKYYERVWKQAPSYRQASLASRAGHLNAGTNYFYCQVKGEEVNAEGYQNDWWLKTDDDSGNSNVWVNAIYVATGSNDGKIPGVPTCSGSAPAPTPAPTGKVYKNVWSDAKSYFLPVAWHPIGVLHHGRNYFYCQRQGAEAAFGGYHNDWWLKTDDDSGNSNVWVNATHVSGGVNDGKIPGVPTC